MAVTTSARAEMLRPDPRSLELVTEAGRLRISLLAEGLVRVRCTAEDAFPPRKSWDTACADEEFAPIHYVIEETEEAVLVCAPPLRIRVKKADLRVSFQDADGRAFAGDLAPIQRGETTLPGKTMRYREGDTIPDGPAKTEWRLRKAMAPDEHYYGFGQRAGLLDRRGRRLTNWTVDPDFGHSRCHDNLYQAHPFFLALRPGLAWGLFLHSSWYTEFTVGAAQADTLEMLTPGAEFDYYLFYGPTPAEVLDKLTRLTGRPFMPPLWALGYHQSRWGYKSEADMRELATEFRDRHLPLDVIHFDIDYMDGFRDFTWHPERFPKPAKLLADLKKQGIRAVTIVDPGVKYDLYSGYQAAKDGLEEGVFLMHAEPDGTPFTGICWPGYALFPDYTRAKTRAWWGKQHAALTKAGVAGIWNDMNEFSIMDRTITKQEPLPLNVPQGDPAEQTVHMETHNFSGALMGRATYEGLLALRPDERPWILTRSAFTGAQRYVAAWMGDNDSWWEHLELSLPQLMSMGLSGLPHVGVDIGGFFENCPPELFARWMALGAFYPFMRNHTCAGTAPQEPWRFGPEIEAIAREYLTLRYRLLPYLYTLAHQAHATGAPLFRPLCYDFPDDPATYHLDDQVMVGPHLLVAPVTRPGRDHRAVYLPAGVWYDYWTRARVTGPVWVTACAPLERIPVFVRGGAVLTLGNARQSTDEPLTELTLEAFPAGETTWTLPEDDGHTFAFERGEIAETVIRLSESADGILMRVEARTGAYQPAPRTLIVRFHLAAANSATLRVARDGQPTPWSWDTATNTVEVRWEDDGQAHELIVG